MIKIVNKKIVNKIIRKVVIFFILALFVLSLLPGVAAQGDNSGRSLANKKILKVVSELEERFEVYQNDGRQEFEEDNDPSEFNDSDSGKLETRKLVEEVREKFKERRNGSSRSDPKKSAAEDDDNEGGSKVEKREQAISETQERLEKVRAKVSNARLKYLQAQERYQQALEEYEEKKSALLSLKKKARTCVEDDDCAEEKKELRKGVQQHLIKTIGVMERSLEKLLDRIEQSNVLTEDEKEESYRSILELETKLNLQKAKLEESAAEMSPEELRQAIQDLKDTWQEVRRVQRRLVSMLISAKQENLIEKHSEYINGMELRIEDLAAQGIDTSELEDLLEEFKEVVARLEEAQADSKEILLGLQSGRDLLDEWRWAQRKISENLRDSRKILRDFLEEYRKLKTELKETLKEEGKNLSEEVGAKEKIKLEVDGDVPLSAEANNLLDELLESFSSQEGEVELKLKVKKDPAGIKVEDLAKGNITVEQQKLWSDLKSMVIVLVNASEEGVELKIELEHELGSASDNGEKE